MKNNTLAILLSAIAALATGACGGLGTPAPRYALYDLGLSEPANPPLPTPPASIQVRAPSWLSSAVMQYRLEYRQPSRREAYAESRWVSPPAEMLGIALDRALIGDSASHGGCRLRLDLDEFVQVFDTPDDSHAEIIARAELVTPRNDGALARKTFVIVEPAPSADADGGVMAHRVGSRNLSAQLISWLAELDRVEGRGLNTHERCKRR